jgi:hypothetical protein
MMTVAPGVRRGPLLPHESPSLRPRDRGVFGHPVTLPYFFVYFFSDR